MRNPELRPGGKFFVFHLLPMVLAVIMMFGSLAELTVFSLDSEKAESSSKENGSTPENNVNNDLIYDYDTLVATYDGEEVTRLELLSHEKKELKATGLSLDANYQWQILHPEKDGLWIDIYDAKTESLSVSMALIENMMDENHTASVRCMSTDGTYAYVTGVVTVFLCKEKKFEVPEQFAEPEVEPVTPLADGEGGSNEFVTVTVEYIQYDFKRDAYGNLVEDGLGGYVFDDGKQAFSPYIATIHSGSDLDANVPFPTMVGYDSFLNDSTTATTSLHIQETEITESIVYTVKYKPALVNYTVRYYFQNIYDDLYVEDSNKKVTTTGYTGATPPDSLLMAENEGFTSLYYQPDSIAADGSTVFEVYYERNYYLMEFDCDGGYGTDTLYNRYGSYVSIPQPIKTGYVFSGWDLSSSDNNTDIVNDGVIDTVRTTIPPYNTGYTAVWGIAETTYNVVYWIDNGDGTQTYVGSRPVDANSGDKVSGSDDIRTDAARYLCGIIPHTHGPACNYSCNLLGHTHGDGNCKCPTMQHTHNDGRCNCPIPIHTHGDGNCTYTCGKDECETHTRACYTFGGYTVSETPANNLTNLSKFGETNGVVVEVYNRYINYWNSNYYVKIGSNYYLITNNGNANIYYFNINNLTVTANCHTHSAACCSLQEHSSHNNSCCSITPHTHNSSCCVLDEHTHNGCKLTCTIELHTHSEECEVEFVDYLEYLEEKTEKNITVKGDGSTVVNVYYKKKVYEIRYVYARKNNDDNSIYIATLTNDGILGNWQDHKVNNIPSITDTRFTEKTEVIDGYTYYYISVRAEYGASIETLWPGNAIGIIDGYSFGSWAAQDKTPYRITYGNAHANIVGPYPYMSDEMIREGNSDIPYTDAVTGEVYYVAQRMSAWWGTSSSISSHTYHIYLESLNGSGDRYYNGKWYTLEEPLDFVAAHNGSTRVDPFDYKGYACINDTNGTSNDLQANSNNFNNNPDCPNSTRCAYCNCFYYDREKYSLSLYSYNSMMVGKGSNNVAFGSDIDSFRILDSDMQSNYYPQGVEPGSLEFGGWYTSPGCYDGTEVDWDTITMPDGDITLYAKWTPVIRKVTFYSAFSDIEADEKDTSSTVYYFMYTDNVRHGSTLGSNYFHIPEWPQDKDPATNGGTLADEYDFVGWFYMDEDNKKRFAPDSMEITRDLVLFAEWQTSIDTTYEVQYVLGAGVSKENTPSKTEYSKGDKVGDTISAHSSVGKTKTFAAKGLSELYSDFRKKFFPRPNTHSILMDLDGDLNKFTFEYFYDDTVFYKVRYVDYTTRTEIATTKVKSTDEAIVTEKFLPIQNYIPQNYYIRKALAYDGSVDGDKYPEDIIEDNVITFYYVKDTEHGLFSVEHYLEYTESTDPNDPNNYYLYDSIVGSADKNTKYTAELREYDGFIHIPKLNTVITYNADGTVKATQTPVCDAQNRPFGTVDYTGLTIKIYYERVMYPYIIEYREYGADPSAPALKVIADGSNKYLKNFDSTLSHTSPSSFSAKDNEENDILYEYYLDHSTEEQRTKTLKIRSLENGKDNPNKLIFYYKKKQVTVYYKAVCKITDVKDFGEVTFYNETAATANALSGSDAMPHYGYKFVGWYYDAECKTAVPDDWLSDKSGEKSHIKPKVLDISKDEVTYYALFAPISGTLIIEKTNVDVYDSNHNFLFNIVGLDSNNDHINLIISIKGNGTETINNVPIGNYTVTELTDWSWDYTATNGSQGVQISEGDELSLTFKNTDNDPNWLYGEGSLDNKFDEND